MSVVGVIGLGYVGLPLVVEFGKLAGRSASTSSTDKVARCRAGIDPSREIGDAEMALAVHAGIYTSDAGACSRDADFIIVAVPTPVDDGAHPGLPAARSAPAAASAAHMKRGAIVVYESTVYPGATEEVCIPVLEQRVGPDAGSSDFFVGYSPERINPGDREHTLTKIVKVVSGDSAETLEQGRRAVRARRRARRAPRSSIKAAEAGKVIENTQRDLNIALMNELAIIFDRIGIDTTRGARGRRHEVELPEVQAGPGRRPLHRRRPVLPDAQGRDARLPPAGDPGRPAHQRRHGQVHRRADDQADDRRRQLRSRAPRSTCSA